MKQIIVAPFSNSLIRDWPAASFAELIGHLVERWRERGLIRVIGTPNQRSRACDVVRDFDPAQVSNECGRLSWPMVLREVRSAACVIGNNSGISHLSAYYGVPTVCVFGGSHQRLEWRPTGFSAAIVSRSIACSPCQLDHGQDCPFGKPCLTEIEPSVVADTALAIMADRGRLSDGPGRPATSASPLPSRQWTEQRRQNTASATA